MTNAFKKLLIFIIILSSVISLCTGCSIVSPDTVTSVSSFKILNGGRLTVEVGNSIQLRLDLASEYIGDVEWSSSGSAVKVSSSGLVTALEEGTASVSASWNSLTDTALIQVVPANESYDDTEKEEFYLNYSPATSPEEAVARSEAGLMSGTLTVPDQAPILSEYRPSINGSFIRNSSTLFDGADTYVVVDAYGNESFRVYRGGAYITLEEVAAYVYAFGDVPANYVSSKNADPRESMWGEYLRLNHSKFSGDTKKYPYEPKLPRISGCGGDLFYYEIDIGTTGTDCDPAYSSRIYNDGMTITRGAARIVYTRYDANNNKIIDPNEKFLFYTYNHYNDFSEYLNYHGGWGEMFGNITGGGKISSKTDYNPTNYVPSIITALNVSNESESVIIYAYVDKRRLASLLEAKNCRLG